VFRRNLSHLEKLNRPIIVNKCSPLSKMSLPCQSLVTSVVEREKCTFTSTLVLFVTSMRNSDRVSIMCCRMFGSTLIYTVNVSTSMFYWNEPLTLRPNYPSLTQKDTLCPRSRADQVHLSEQVHRTNPRGREGTMLVSYPLRA
jgi:hypothetical protein